MELREKPCFHNGLVTLKADEYLAVHEENFYLRQENQKLKAGLKSILDMGKGVLK